jgi:hypothetical protein
VIIHYYQARQAPPRNLATGRMENQLTGAPVRHTPAVQGSGNCQVVEIPDEPYIPTPQPVFAPYYPQGPTSSLLVELVEEDSPGISQPHESVAESEFHEAPRKAGKRRSARGEEHGRAKLSEKNAAQIRSLAGDVSITKLARLFGVSRAAIRKVIRYETWHDDSWSGTWTP